MNEIEKLFHAARAEGVRIFTRSSMQGVSPREFSEKSFFCEGAHTAIIRNPEDGDWMVLAGDSFQSVRTAKGIFDSYARGS